MPIKFNLMNRLHCILLAIFGVMLATSLSAQFTRSKIIKPSVGTIEFSNEVKRTTMVNQYRNPYLEQAIRKRIRKERNFVEFIPTLSIAQNQLTNWAPGGSNSFSGRSTIFFRHEHKREKLRIDYRFEARYGINVVDKQRFKNEDEFKINFLTTWKIKHNWSYAASVNLRSQFMEGQASRTNTTKVSTFMSPGFLDISAGFNYKKDKSPFEITISPVTGSMTIVRDDELSAQGIHGVKRGEHTKSQLGPSIRANLDWKFAKNRLRYRSNIYSFSNMKNKPTARWENTLDIAAMKFVTLTGYALFYYDNTANTPTNSDIQVNSTFTIGLSYRFANK